MRSHSLAVLAAAAVLVALPYVAAHGDEVEDGMEMNMGMTSNSTDDGESIMPIWEDWEPSYFRNGGHASWMLIHIILMMLSWCFIMPVAIMLSIARSRYHLPAQVVFHTANGLGIFASFVYNHATPDLYVVNAHHPLSWVLASLTIFWTILSVCTAFNDYMKSRNTKSVTLSSPVDSPTEYSYADRPAHLRYSQDSGMFSGHSSRTNSQDSITKKEESQPLSPATVDDFADVEFESSARAERRGFLGNSKVEKLLSRHATAFAGAKVSAAIRFTQIVLEKFLLLLGFTAIATGFVTYGGIFRGVEAFSGAAHYVKGAIFVWYGVLTLGRWMGAFSEFGWAWNLRPKSPSVARWKTYIPSAEFTESFVIWLYGASNVFLEHLGSDSGVWAPQDFEHLSITVLFFGGGLLGMFIEQQWIRNLLATQTEVQKSKEPKRTNNGQLSTIRESGAVEAEEWETPVTEKVSMNPMPALTIMLLGSMMSAHHQKSMVSTMMHKQWGTLFAGFAMSRLATYALMYIKPPTSHYPSRPPSELVASFCLMSGGLLFMNSARDSVRAVETNGLDAMTIFTMTLGLTGVIMAWEIACFAIKGWAKRRERAAAGKALP